MTTNVKLNNYMGTFFIHELEDGSFLVRLTKLTFNRLSLALDPTDPLVQGVTYANLSDLTLEEELKQYIERHTTIEHTDLSIPDNESASQVKLLLQVGGSTMLISGVGYAIAEPPWMQEIESLKKQIKALKEDASFAVTPFPLATAKVSGFGPALLIPSIFKIKGIYRKNDTPIPIPEVTCEDIDSETGRAIWRKALAFAPRYVDEAVLRTIPRYNEWLANHPLDVVALCVTLETLRTGKFPVIATVRLRKEKIHWHELRFYVHTMDYGFARVYTYHSLSDYECQTTEYKLPKTVIELKPSDIALLQEAVSSIMVLNPDSPGTKELNFLTIMNPALVNVTNDEGVGRSLLTHIANAIRRNY